MSKVKLPVIITPTRAELGLRCYRRHALADILLRARYASASLEFGSVVHAGVGAWWTAAKRDKTVDEAKQLAHSALQQEWDKRFTHNARMESPGDHTLALAQGMLEGYFKQATGAGPFELETNDWQIVSTEERIEVELGGDTPKGSKVSVQQDRVLFNKNKNHLIVVDTKTASRMDKRWERPWATSLQMKLYHAVMATAYDMPVENVSVVIEGVLKDVPTQVRYIPCPQWSEEMLDEAMAQARIVANRDYKLVSFEGQPRNQSDAEEIAVNHTPLNYQSCFEYNVECPFYGVCTAEPNERGNILRAEYFEIPEEEAGY